MLSTATFAWFTSNDQVTATGMNVQAQAAGNLVIHTAALTAANQEIKVDFSDANGATPLIPVTYDSTASGWKTSYGSEATVDGLYGNQLGGTLANVDASTAGSFFKEYTVYIATAGEKLDGQDLWVKINALSGIDQTIAPAYSIAFWVLGENEAPDYNKPTSHYSYKDYQTALASGAMLKINTANVNIPTTDGVGVDDPVGVKIVMRVYVDGALGNGVKHKDYTYNYRAITADSAWSTIKQDGRKVYLRTGSTAADYTYSLVNTETWEDNYKIPANYFYLDPSDITEVEVEGCYVNNQSVPTDATNFAVVFMAKDATTQG
jgi:hypothetical protein